MGQSLYILPWPPSTLRGLISSMLILLRPTRSASESYYPFICKCHVCQIPFSKSFSKSFRAPFFQKRLNLALIPLKCSVPRARSDPVGESEPKPRERSVLFLFIFSVIKFLFSKVSRPESPARPEWRIRTGARFTPTFSFILAKHLFIYYYFFFFI